MELTVRPQELRPTAMRMRMRMRMARAKANLKIAATKRGVACELTAPRMTGSAIAQ
jgi:hypothetical protein